MPVFAADLLPDATGRNLGNDSQRWNANLQSLNVKGVTTIQPVPGQVITPGGVIYVLTSPITANANSTTYQNLASVPLPAGLINAAGKVVRGVMTGVYTTQAGQTPVMGIAVNMPPGIFVISLPVQLPAAQANLTWRVEFTLTVSTPGSAAMIETGGTMFWAVPSGSTAYKINPNSTSMGPTDLTVASVLQTVCTFSTNTSPANVCILRQFVVEVLN